MHRRISHSRSADHRGLAFSVSGILQTLRSNGATRGRGCIEFFSGLFAFLLKPCSFNSPPCRSARPRTPYWRSEQVIDEVLPALPTDYADAMYPTLSPLFRPSFFPSLLLSTFAFLLLFNPFFPYLICPSFTLRAFARTFNRIPHLKPPDLPMRI